MNYDETKTTYRKIISSRLGTILGQLLDELQRLASIPNASEQFMRHYLNLSADEDYTRVSRSNLSVPVAATFSVHLLDALKQSGWKVLKMSSTDGTRSPSYQQVPVGPGKNALGLFGGLVACRRNDERMVLMVSLPIGVDLRDDTREISAFVPDKPEAVERANKALDELATLVRQQMFYRGQLLGFETSDILTFLEATEVTDQDFIVAPEIREQLYHYLVDPAIHYKTLEAMGISPWRGIILEGPPGCGKTLAGRWVWSKIGPLGFTMIVASPTALISTPNATIPSLFTMARDLEPCLVWLEDLDFIAMDRREGRDASLGALLQALDGVGSRGRVMVAATTNVPDILDEAISRRPGRFDVHIRVDLPNEICRREMLERFCRPLREQGILDEIPADLAEKTNGMSGAYIRELVHAATISAVAEAHIHGIQPKVQSAHFYRALERLNNRKNRTFGFTRKEGEGK